MNKIFKLIGILFALSLLALPLTGCDGSSVLVLHVNTPNNGASITTPTVAVSGYLGGSQAYSAKVTVNDTDVPVKDQKFSTDVKLNDGKNVIRIGATIQTGFEQKEELTVTYAPTK
jgi:hypothetical protein